MASSSTEANATTRSTAYRVRVRPSPSRTASVRFPVTESVGMSRRLLTTSRAVASRPTGTAATTASSVICSDWT